MEIANLAGTLREWCFCRRESEQRKFCKIVVNEVLLFATDKLVLFDIFLRNTVV